MTKEKIKYEIAGLCHNNEAANEAVERIWALFSVSGILDLKQIDFAVTSKHFNDVFYGNSPEECEALINKTRAKIGYTKEDVDNYR